MRPRHLGLALALLIVAILGYGAYRQATSVPMLHATSSLKLTAAEIKGAVDIALDLRDVTLAGVRRMQVKLLGGTWIDCDLDCQSAVLRAGPQIWEAMQTRSR